MTTPPPTHDPVVSYYAGTHWQPEEVTVTCTACDWSFESQESAGGGVGPWGDAWQDHLDALPLEAAARHLNVEGWTCGQGTHEPGAYDTCTDCQDACDELAAFLDRVVPDYVEEFR